MTQSSTAPFSFPRNEKSAFKHITIDAVTASVKALIEGCPSAVRRAQVGNDRQVATMLAGLGGWDVIEVLKAAAACALMQGLDTTNYNLALVRQALLDYYEHQ